MRKLVMLSAAAMLAFGVTGPANAALLSWEGTLILELGTLPQIPATGGGVATVNHAGGLGHLGDLRLKASRGVGIITEDAMAPVTDPGALPIVSIRVTATLGTGTVGPISGGVQSASVLTKNTLPVAGLARICLYSTTCAGTLDLDLTEHTAGTVTKGLGIGGIITIGKTSPIRISVEAAPSTVKTKTSIDQQTIPPVIGNKYVRHSVGQGLRAWSSSTPARRRPRLAWFS